MDTLLQDLRYAARQLLRSPGFTLVATLSLGLGIGANATIFTWMDAVLFQPFPAVPEQHRLVSFDTVNSAGEPISTSWPDFRDFKAQSRSLVLWASEERAMSLVWGGVAERAWGVLVSGDYFDALGVRAIAGRTFTPEESRVPDTHPVIVLSHGYWQRRFAGRPEVVGQAVTLNNRAFTIVGIAPEGFVGSSVGLRYDFFAPMMMQKALLEGDRLELRGHRWLSVAGRLKPGATLEQAQAEARTIAAALAQAYPRNNEGMTAAVGPLWLSRGGAARAMRPLLFVLMAVVAAVLLIACANLANLLLARALGRGREIAIRLSLGAGRARVVRQLLTESALLALLGAGAGILVAYWSTGLFMFFAPPADLPIGLNAAVDLRAFGFALALGGLTAIVFGMTPALAASRPDVIAVLRDGAATLTGGRGRTRLKNGLVVVQVALALVLLVGAGLLVRALRSGEAFATGFDTDRVLLASVDLFPNGYDRERGLAFYAAAQQALAELPAVESASLAQRVPLALGGTNSSGFQFEGYTPRDDDPAQIYTNLVGASYLKTIGIPLREGRDFAAEDRAGQLPVAIVNEVVAERYWPGQSPLGRRLRPGGDTWLTVVGVAKNTRLRSLDERPLPMVYMPIGQQYTSAAVALHVRAREGDPAGLAPAVTEALRRLDPALPVFGVRTLREATSAATYPQRMASTLLTAFGALALALATLGLYGVLAWAVGQRRREMGIRLALGGRRRDVFVMVVREGLGLATLGIGCGLLGAFGLARALGRLLLGVSPADPVTYASVVLLLGTAAAVACAIPARRAAATEPATALRYE
ncbi:MAG: ABC transporter permease [Vicinamibacteria bacterium]|nr:ABC transporter permease [Vicinamibacteria bacterium]